MVKEDVILGCAGGDRRSKYIIIQAHVKWLSTSEMCFLTSVGRHALTSELRVQLPVCPVRSGVGGKMAACLPCPAFALPAPESGRQTNFHIFE